jgi:uncharacterized protein (DUF433 family)
MGTILAFTVEQASKLTGLSDRQLRYWDDTNYFNPTYSDMKRRPYGRIYSFHDVVGLRTLAMLRNEHKIPLQELRKIGAWLKQNYGTPWASLRFFVAGCEVYFDDPRDQVRRSGSNPDQTVIPIEMQRIAAETEAAADKLRERTPDEIGTIVRHRYTSHNAPLIVGTRIRTEAIWNFHQAGYSTDEIIRQYPRLTAEDVQAAITYEQRRRISLGSL